MTTTPQERTVTTTTATKPACIASGCPDVGIYVASLSAYNNGILHGAWIDLEGDIDEEGIQEGIDWVLSLSPDGGAEEYAVHDSAGLPGYLSQTEWPALGELVAWADGLSAYADEDSRDAYRLACEDQGQTIDEDSFRETYCGTYNSGEDYAEELADELGCIPEGVPWPFNCIDWEGVWRQLRYDGYREEDCNSGGVHIFRSC
jgi:antirestriction protein